MVGTMDVTTQETTMLKTDSLLIPSLLFKATPSCFFSDCRKATDKPEIGKSVSVRWTRLTKTLRRGGPPNLQKQNLFWMFSDWVPFL